MSGLYIHIPFCKQACSYCDFYFVTREQLMPAFMSALIKEVRSPGLWNDQYRTLYVGGGTPSRLASTPFLRLVDALNENMDFSYMREFTVEVNPEDVTDNWLYDLKHSGVTRLSMGIQSFQPHLLTFLHRAHTANQARRALEKVASAGFKSFSVDFIYGIPGQTMDQLNNDLRQLMEYHPPHVSAYSLTIEPKTRLGKQYKLGRLRPVSDEVVVGQSVQIRETLEGQGIRQYEISNYAVPGHESVHNSACWRHENYLGLGPAAHSFYWSQGANKAIRRFHPPDIHTYLREGRSQKFLEKNMETLSLETLARERLMMGLRTKEGVSEEELSVRYGYSLSMAQKKQIVTYRKEGLMEPDDPLRLTDKGLLLADAVTLQLI